MDTPPEWYHTWDFLRPQRVDWSLLPSLVLTEVGMMLVVALSSSLDVATIELELKTPLDYNHEFEQLHFWHDRWLYWELHIQPDHFLLRAGVRSRLAGFVLASFQILFLELPFPILA